MQLETNKLLYVDMINSLKQQADILYEEEHALLIRDKHSAILYACADDVESAKLMIEKLPVSFEILVSHDLITNAVLKEMKDYTYENCCYHCVHLSDKPFEIAVPKGYTIKHVTRMYMEEVIALYGKQMPSLANEAYMGQTMDAGMYGIFEGSILCGFIGVHEGGHGSIGMLEVKAEYQHRGFGVLLEKVMINEQLKRGYLPYGEIFIENLASLKLQEKIGIAISEDLTYWYYQ